MRRAFGAGEQVLFGERAMVFFDFFLDRFKIFFQRFPA